MSYVDVLKNIIKNNKTEYIKKETLRYEFSLYLEDKSVNTRLIKIAYQDTINEAINSGVVVSSNFGFKLK